MNIFIVATTPFSVGRGSHIRILHEAIAFAQKGNDVEIITYPFGNNPIELNDYGIKIVRTWNCAPWYKKKSPGPSFWKLILDKVLFWTLLFRVMNKKVDIIYAHGYEAIFLSFIVQRILFWKKIKFIGDFHGGLVSEMSLYSGMRKKLFSKCFGALERLVHSMPNVAIASSHPLAEHISKNRKNKCSVVYDAPSIPFVDHSRKEMREKYGIKQDLFVVVYTGGFTKDKGIANLFSLIQKANHENVLWLIAGGPHSELKIPIENIEKVKVISPLDELVLSELLSLADCAVDPKERNSLQASGKMINYMQYGLPVLCFDDMVSRDYLGDDLARMFSGKTLEDIAEKIQNLQALQLNEKKILKEKIQNRARIFSWKDVLKNI